MKSRQGFVSNSSSSSFCIIGFDVEIYEQITQEDFDFLTKIEFWDRDDATNDPPKNLDEVNVDDLCIGFGCEVLPNGLLAIGSEGISHIGLDLEGLLVEENLNFDQMKDKLYDLLIECGITSISRSNMKMIYGEAGNG